MTPAEIDSMCSEVASATGLPTTWVKHHVDAKAGRPCPRCSGSGSVGRGVCYRCRGSGGRATPEAVATALDWVRANAGRVRALGEKRDANAPEVEARRMHRRVVRVETWKKDHADLWEALEEMLPCDFRDSMVRAVESGRLTVEQEGAIRRVVAATRRRLAPQAGATVEVRARITSARDWMDGRDRRVFRIDIATTEGWSGRVETTDSATVAAVQGRRRDEVVVRGRVSWSREGYAIVSDPVKLVFGW